MYDIEIKTTNDVINEEIEELKELREILIKYKDYKQINVKKRVLENEKLNN